MAIYVASVVMVAVHLLLVAANGLSPFTYLAKSRETLVMAFSSRSSLGTLPLTIATLTERMGVSAGAANLVGSLGATMGMNGCAGFFPAMLVVMVGHMVGLELNLQFYLMTLIVVIVGSIGVAGIPGAATIAATIALSGMGLGEHFALIGMVLAIDPIMDSLARTLPNVSGAMTSALVTDKQVGSSSTGRCMRTPGRGSARPGWSWMRCNGRRMRALRPLIADAGAPAGGWWRPLARCCFAGARSGRRFFQLPVPLVDEDAHGQQRDVEAKRARLPVPGRRLPHQEPLAADDHESQEPQHEAGQHASDGPALGMRELRSRRMPRAPQRPGATAQQGGGGDLAGDDQAIQRVPQEGAVDGPPAHQVPAAVEDAVHGQHMLHEGQVGAVVHQVVEGHQGGEQGQAGSHGGLGAAGHQHGHSSCRSSSCSANI